MSFAAVTGNGRYDRASKSRYDDYQDGRQDRGRGSRDDGYGRLTDEDSYHRERRRSPGLSRRRSRSPGDRERIDRYVPGEGHRPTGRRDSHGIYDSPGHGGYPPVHHNQQRGGGIDRYIPPGGPAPMHQQNLQDPNKFDFVVPFAYFSEWIYQQVKLGLVSNLSAEHKKTGQIPKEDIQERYDAYKDATNARLKKDFVNSHMNEQWFREKYYPGEREVVRQKIVEYRKTRWPEWKKNLDSGAFDNIDMDGRVIAHLSEKKDEVTAGDGDDGEEAVIPTAPDTDVRDEAVFKPTLLIKTISPTVSRAQLEEQLCSQIEGFQFLSLSDPNPLKKYHRIAFIILNADAPPVDATTIENLGERKIHDETHGDFTCHIGIHTAPKELKRKVLNSLMSTPENLRKQAELVEKAARKLEEELGDGFEGWDHVADRARMLHDRAKAEQMEEEAEEGEDSDDEKEDLALVKKTIDIGVEYLRRVFSFCIFCMAEADSMHELTRKCPGGHTRRPAPSSDATPDPRSVNWIRVWQEKAELFVDPLAQDLKKLGGKPVHELLEEELAKNCKVEEEGKYRCKIQTCSKLFKGEVFWRKHVEKRHKDWTDKIELEATLVNNYALDPGRVMPPKPDHMMQTPQRQFPPLTNFQAMPQAPFPFIANHQQPSPYMGLPPAPPTDLRRDQGGPGPIRRRDNRGGHGGAGGYRAAPYGQNRRRSPGPGRDRGHPRRDEDRNGRFNRDGADAGGDSRRSLRSYMDLDANKDTTKVEELDY